MQIIQTANRLVKSADQIIQSADKLIKNDIGITFIPEVPVLSATPSSTSILLSVRVVTHGVDVVQYKFTALTVGGHSSDWQTGLTYTDSGLTSETQYQYVVQARNQRTGKTSVYSSVATSTTISANYTNQITQYGITWTFRDSHEYGTFINGDYWVVGPVNIIMIDPISSIGESFRIGYVPPDVHPLNIIRNGTMVNPRSGDDNRYGPAYNENNTLQGFDNRLGFYTASLNKGRPNNADISNSNPLYVANGSSVVSSISRYEDGNWNADPKIQQLLGISILTVLSVAPSANSFRPGYCGEDKSVHFTIDDIDDSSLGSYALIDSGRPILFKGDGTHGDDDNAYQNDTLERMVERPWFDFGWGQYGSYLHQQYNMESDGRDLSAQVAWCSLVLNSSNYTLQEKRKLLIGLVQIGIDNYSVHQGIIINNETWAESGQISCGRKFPILFAGKILNDSAMLEIGSESNEVRFAEDDQTFYITQYDIDHYSATPSGGQVTRLQMNDNVVTYYINDDLGVPEWGILHTDLPRYDTKDWGAVYRYQVRYWFGFILSTYMMGLKTQWNHDALFDYVDRNSSVENETISGAWIRDAWNTYRPSFGNVWGS